MAGQNRRRWSGNGRPARQKSGGGFAFARSLGLVALGAALALAATTWFDLPAAFDAWQKPARVASVRAPDQRSRMPAVKRPDRSIETAAVPVPRPARPRADANPRPGKPVTAVMRPPADIVPTPKAAVPGAPQPEKSPARPDTVRLTGLNFPICGAGPGPNCVVDGDTFVLNGKAIRVADIDTPEAGQPKCQREAMLAARAKERLQQLLNAGPIELRAISRDQDIYGRKLRTVHRDGRSLGDTLISEGLARRWIGRKQSWCA